MSKFFCDSNCELHFLQIKEFDVNLIKMPYTIGGEQIYYDLGESGVSADFFDRMRNGADVKTQALNYMDYIEYFEPVLQSGEDIFYVTFSRKMSATFESMDKAIGELKEKYPMRTVTYVDSKGISIGAGLVVYFAAKMHKEGAADEQIKEFVESFRQNVCVYFTVNDLVYLKRGGRLSSFKAMMGSILNLKPLIELRDGALVSYEKEKGRKKALAALISKLEKNEVNLDYPIVVMNADSKNDSDEITKKIEDLYDGAKIWNLDIGPVVGCHCGPDTVGVAFIKK